MPEKNKKKALVRDVGIPLDTARKKATVGIPLIFFSLSLGFVVGAVVCALLSAVNLLINFVWGTLGGAVNAWWFPVAICTLGGLICGLYTKYICEPPSSLKVVLGTVKRTGEYHMPSLSKGIGSFLIPLVFGGSVGPEAGLTGIIAVMCTKIGSLLSRAGVRAKSSADLSVSATLSAVFGAPFLGAIAGVEDAMPDEDAYSYRRPVKVILYTSVAFGALAGMQVVSLIPATSSGLPRFEAIDAHGMSLFWIVPCIAAGWILALIYFSADYGLNKLCAFLRKPIVILPVVCGLIMGFVSLALPNVLFSGEEQIREIVETYASGGIAAVTNDSAVEAISLSGAAILLFTAIAKSILTPLCLNFGWRGGHFFPMIFAGASLGFAIAALSGADAMLCATATTASLMGAIMRKPLAAGALLLLCFPASSVVWMAFAALIGASLPMPFTTKDTE